MAAQCKLYQWPKMERPHFPWGEAVSEISVLPCLRVID